VALSSGAFVFRGAVLRRLRRSPRLILGVAALQVAVVSLDGLPATPYFASCLIPIGVAILVGGLSLAWGCAALVDGALGLSMLGVGSAPSFVGGAGTALGALLAPPAATLVLATLSRAYERTTEWIAEQMNDANASLRPLASVQHLLPRGLSEYEPTTPWACLTPSEIRVASALARLGKTAGIAHSAELAQSTVDNELASAMRKTGCCTRSQLAALTAHPEWPGGVDEH
jgi:DNA-binding CsgD family transcriptional regulator